MSSSFGGSVRSSVRVRATVRSGCAAVDRAMHQPSGTSRRGQASAAVEQGSRTRVRNVSCFLHGGWRHGRTARHPDVRACAVVPVEHEPTHEPTYDQCPARHCWVADALDAQGVKRPGLLVEWRQADQGWEGRVVYVARARPDRWVLVEEWVSAALLTPV